MSLLCRECNAPLAGSYQIICLLTGLVRPDESPLRQLVCQRHVIQPLDTVEQSRLQQEGADALIFVVVPGTPSMVGNLSGAYLMDQDLNLKKNGDFDRAAYLTSAGFRTTFPRSFESLLTEAKDWPNEFKAYKKAIGECLVNLTQADQLRKQEEVNRHGAKHQLKQHDELIRSAVDNALTNLTVPLDVVSQLNAVGLLQSSTGFRSSSQFPGEHSVLNYEFDKEKKYFGFLGFDRNNVLISIDERYPMGRRLYRKGKVEAPEWTEIQ